MLLLALRVVLRMKLLRWRRRLETVLLLLLHLLLLLLHVLHLLDLLLLLMEDELCTDLHRLADLHGTILLTM